ncbi:hypothetical protein [Cohnella thermotolerans]|uniref:hypothetical protein n=1 Tax=Cohnella thermotolerans TaxID=329858 RepID=UPI00047937C2|nr:hypothetical protein [Cohnella thermotolerans]
MRSCWDATVCDVVTGLYRAISYRDIAILLWTTAELAPVVVDELKAAGIPACADLATGYFAAAEVNTMMPLMQIIDNPDQDIPLTGCSPIVGLSAEDLMQIRLANRRALYRHAVRSAAADERTNPELRSRLADFFGSAGRVGTFARRKPIGDPIGYYTAKLQIEYDVGRCIYLPIGYPLRFAVFGGSTSSNTSVAASSIDLKMCP